MDSVSDALPTEEEAFGAAPSAPKGLPTADEAFGASKAPASNSSTLRQLDEKYLGGMGRQAVLAARAIPDAAIGLASMPIDAYQSTKDYVKERLNGRPFSLQDLNPFSAQGGYRDPNLASNQAGALLNKYLPEPETTTEKVAHGVESFLAGAKMPVPGGVGTAGATGARTAAELAPQARAVTPGAVPMGAQGAAPAGYGINFAGAAAIPGAPKAGDTARAAEIVKKRLLSDYVPWEQGAANVKEANEQGVPLRLTDLGTNTHSTGEVLAQKPGEASSVMLNDRNAILADTKERVGERVRSALDAQGDVGTAEDQLATLRSKNAKENYEAVRNDPQAILDPEIWKILENPDVAATFQNAKNMSGRVRSLDATMGKSTPPLADIYAPRVKPTPEKYPNQEPGVIDTSKMRNPPEPPRPNEPNAPVPTANQETDWVRTGTAPDVRTLDFLQRALNTRIGQLYSQARNGVGSQGGEGDLATSLKTARQAIVDRLKDQSPSFKKAMETYGDDTEVMEAMQAGRNGGKDSFFAMSPEQAQSYVSGLSESGKAALRMGVADRLLSAAEMSGRNTNLASDILGGEKKTQILHTLFDGDEQKFDLFRQALEKEALLFRNNNAIRGGSQTYRRLQAGEDFSDASKAAETLGKGFTIASQVSHHWMGAAVHGLIRLMQKPNWNPSVATQTAKILSAKDPADAVAGLQSLEESLTTGVTGNKAKAVVQGTKGLIGDNTGDRLKDKYGVLQ
jgi:hypothetical protein